VSGATPCPRGTNSAGLLYSIRREKGRPWKRWDDDVNAVKFPVPVTRSEEDTQYRKR